MARAGGVRRVDASNQREKLGGYKSSLSGGDPHFVRVL